MLGENTLIFALDPKLDWAAETLVLHSGPKFMCLVVHYDKQFSSFNIIKGDSVADGNPDWRKARRTEIRKNPRVLSVLPR